MSGLRWTEEVEARCSVEDVAAALGWPVWSKAGARGFPCPEHPDKHSDGRPTGRIVHGGRAWYCHRGQHGGGAVSLVSFALFGSATVRGADFHAVRAWFAERGWCTPWEQSRRRIDPVPVRAPVPALKSTREPPPARLPSGEVEALWGAATAPHLGDGVDPWLYTRGLACRALAALDVARVLPSGTASPDWAGFVWQDKRTGQTRRKSWADAGWRLLLPVFDADGRMVALRARWTGVDEVQRPAVDADSMATYLHAGWTETPPPFAGKEVSPRGEGACRGAVYADPVGQWLLRGGFGLPDPAAPGLTWDGRVLVVEGGPGFLHYATRRGRVSGSGSTYAVLGVWSGAWGDDVLGRRIARRLKAAEGVAVACDDDAGGDRIGAPIFRALQSVGCRAMAMEWSEVVCG